MNNLTNKYLRTLLLTLSICFSISVTIGQQNNSVDKLNGKWEILPNASEFSFNITTIWIFPVSGTMSGLSGEIDFDKKNTDKFVHLSLKPSTLKTGNDKRDEHLRSEDFFYVSEYPSIEFKGNSIELQDPDANIYNVKGDLTIRGVTHEETIPVKFEGFTTDNNERIKFTGSVKINRNDYDVDFTGRIIADNAKVKYTIIAQKK